MACKLFVVVLEVVFLGNCCWLSSLFCRTIAGFKPPLRFLYIRTLHLLVKPKRKNITCKCSFFKKTLRKGLGKKLAGFVALGTKTKGLRKRKPGWNNSSHLLSFFNCLFHFVCKAGAAVFSIVESIQSPGMKTNPGKH
jgi:hypothetical protein